MNKKCGMGTSVTSTSAIIEWVQRIFIYLAVYTLNVSCPPYD